MLIFDEATSNLDQQTAEHFAQTVNQLKVRVTMVFIAHALPKGLQVDEVVQFAQRPSGGDAMSSHDDLPGNMANEPSHGRTDRTIRRS